MSNSLAIKRLEIIEYPPPEKAGSWKTHLHLNPEWQQVEKAIRDLNHYCLPFIVLGLTEDRNREDDEYFSIFGGPGGYSINSSDVRYADPTHSSGEEIAIWTSDQGYYPKERYVTYNLNLAIQIVHYYALFGKLDPSVLWE